MIAQVRAGGNRRLQMLAAEGVLPVERDDLIRLQVSLCACSDQEVAERALTTLQGTDPRLLARVVDGADAEWLELLIEKLPHPTVLEAILSRRQLPASVLVRLAGWLPADLQDVLLLRQEDIRQHPAILEALSANPYLSPNSERIIGEYRDYLLPERPKERLPTEAEVDAITPEEVEEAIAEVASTVAERGEYEESTGLTESQIRSLPVTIRFKLAFGASRTLRNILLRDPSPQVAVTALTRSAISEREIEQLCRNRTIAEEVLTEISLHREWVGKYRIQLGLVRNPRTPIAISMRLLPRLAARDLRVLGVDRNLPDPVRGQARRLYRQKVNN